MAARRKYTEESECIVSPEFIDAIMELDKSVAVSIGEFLDRTITSVDNNMIVPETWGGVVDNMGDDFYFSIKILSQCDGEYTAIIDINEITLNEYLDLINSNRYLNERVDIYNEHD